MRKLYILSECFATHSSPRMAFEEADRDALFDYMTSHSTPQVPRTWSVDVVQVYDPPVKLTNAERQERKKQAEKTSLPEPLSR